MFRFKSFLTFKFYINEVSILLLYCFLVFMLLIVSDEIASNEVSSCQSNCELLPTDSLQKEKSVNITNKLICFFVFTRDFSPEVMSGLCTHIHVGFFRINNRTYELEVSHDQEQILAKVLLLKAKSKDLEIIISVGGAGEMGFSLMVSNHTTRKIFIKSCMDFIKKFNIDGIDLDWEWPVAENGNEKEKVKFVQLLQEIQVEFRRHKKNYILSVDVPSSQAIMELGYLVKYIADFVDYVNVMCYDYHYFTRLFPFTGHNAPLYSSGDNLFFNSNVNHSIYLWISSAMPREKIVLGMPTYGHTFELTFPNKYALGVPAKNFGSIGQNGFAGYQQICEFIRNNKTTVVYDVVSKTPYAYQFPEWISFDDEGSLAIKASYVLEQKLAGAMVFSVNAEDYSGSCNGDNIPLPLIRKMSQAESSEMVHCPYNKSHMVLKTRLAAHLIKCRQQHSVDKYATCPFNSTHDVPAVELEFHVERCPDRKNLENFLYVIGEPKQQDLPSELEVPVSGENWDEDTQVGSYLDVMNKKLENEKVFRIPSGMTKGQKKTFFKNEVMKFSTLDRSSDTISSSTSTASTSGCQSGRM